MEQSEHAGAERRRRVRVEHPRRRKIVVRFSDDELTLVRERAELANLAVGAWIGETVVDVARSGRTSVALPDLLRLHADVLIVQRIATQAEVGRHDVLALLTRLDSVVDHFVGSLGTYPGRRT